MTKNIDNTTVKFYGKVSDTTKETSIKTVEKLKQNMNNDQFFDRLTVNIGKRYRKIDYDNKLSKNGLFFDYNTKGYCNIFDDKQCYISEKAHKRALNLSNFIDKTSTVADKEDIQQLFPNVYGKRSKTNDSPCFRGRGSGEIFEFRYRQRRARSVPKSKLRHLGYGIWHREFFAKVL